MKHFILLLLGLIIFLSLHKNIEMFNCYSSLFKKLNIGYSKLSAFKIKNNKEYINTNLITTTENIKKIIESIPKSKPKTKYREYSPYRNDYYKISGYRLNKEYITNFILKVYNYISPLIIAKSELYNSKLCNKYTKCTLSLRDKSIKMIGYNNYGNIIIEGQLLLKYNISSYNFLIDFVASNEDSFKLHYLELKGINLVNNLDSYKSNNYSEINKSNNKIITNKVINFKDKKRNREDIYKFSYSCYGRKAIDKSNCQNLYFKTGNPQTVIGVWDKKCQTNTECPFYKANKNYNNNFGKCNSGKCELPLGAIRISPRKFKSNSVLMCHRCKKGTDCCEDQKDKKLYPNLKSPDYMFLGDYRLRKNL